MFNAKVGSLVQPTSTGNQSYSGIGFQPKAILFFLNNLTGDGSEANAHLGIGAAISASNRAAVAVNSYDTFASSDTNRRHTNAACLTLFDQNQITLCEADLVSFDSDGFTLNWIIANATQRIINYLALGGDELTDVFLKQFNCPTTTGSQATTGVGFKPDAVILFTVLISTTPPSVTQYSLPSFGFATQNLDQATVNGRGEPAISITNNEKTQRTDNIIDVTNGGVSFARASITSFDSDGFTLNWTTAPTSARSMWALCLKGGRYNVGAFNQKTSTGTDQINGIGFKPKALLLASFNNVATTSIVANQHMSIGIVSDQTNRGCIWYGDQDNIETSIADSDLDRTKVIKMMTEGTPTTNAAADLSSFDSDGFTIDWTTADATARQIVYLAFGSSTEENSGGQFQPGSIHTSIGNRHIVSGY